MLENQPVVSQQTIAQNEAVETVLSRFSSHEIVIPSYQRDADQWDDNKKSLFLESVLNRLTVPAFYFALSEESQEVSEVVDGQQRLTTIEAFFTDHFRMSQSGDCPYFGNSSHYSGKVYSELDDAWQKVFRRYNLTLVTLPASVDLSLRLEIFRRINEGGTPLSGQDIRLSYYSQSLCVRFVQSVGIFDPSRSGSNRMLRELGYDWPWAAFPDRGEEWKEWWEGSRGAVGQTASEMFLWYLIGCYRDKVCSLLEDPRSLSKLKLQFRGNTVEVLDIVCAHFKQEDLVDSEPRLFPSLDELRTRLFPEFSMWWFRIRSECGPNANVAKHRAIALLIPSLVRFWGDRVPSENQWGYIGRFLKSARQTAREVLKIEFPEPKGRWVSQNRQLEAFDDVAEKIYSL